MNLVLGLSMTSTAIRWVLVEGTTGEGATNDHGAFDLAAAVDPDDLLDVLLVDQADNRIHAIGVAWTNAAEAAASGVLEALTARGLDNVIAVSELEAADVLAAGIAGIAEYDDVAVCIVEPEAALVAVVNSDGVTVDRIARPLDGADVVELPASVIAMMELNEWRPDAIFVVGSAADLDLVITTLTDATASPVFSAAEADLALARGAALASARAVNALDTPVAHPLSRIAALTSVLAAAVVTFVVSLSVALGLQLAPDTDPGQPQVANADEPAAAATAPSPPQAATKVPGPAAPPAAPRPANRPPSPSPAATPWEARLVVAKTIAVGAPPAPAVAPPAGPVYEPPAAAPVAPPPVSSPPAPAYAPPAQTPYVPPVAPKPRIRDRILERIPIINRFHEPEYQYPQ